MEDKPMLSEGSVIELIKSQVASINELLRGVIALAQESLRVGMLINGGAVVALLALAGTLVGKGERVIGFVLPLAFFAFGLFCSAAATFLAYLAQYGYLQESNKALQRTLSGEGGSTVAPDSNAGNGWRAAAILAGVSSLLFFLAGLIASLCLFMQL